MKKLDVGGQAIIEGVMMKQGDTYSIAVRKPDKEIILEKRNYRSFSKRYKIFGLPVIRGAVAFLESMVMGMKILTFSAEFFEVEGEEASTFEKKMEAKWGKKRMDDFVIGLSVVLATVLSIGLFILLPLGIASLLSNVMESSRMINFVDGIIRVVILLAYITAISKMKDIQRVFQYHGAEHKSIHCYEKDEELTVDNVRKQPRLHKRCGTNFLFIVVLVSVAVLTVFSVDTFVLRLLVRLGLMPVIAGLSYEVLKMLGKHDNPFVDAISYPGLMLQKITTREPDDSQIEVAIAALKGALNEEISNDKTASA